VKIRNLEALAFTPQKGYVMKKNAIVVGMPRSGTSMVTNIFAQSGYFAVEDESSDLRAGDEFNPSGYWEAQDLIDANVEIFGAVGYSPHNTWLKEAITTEQAEQILQLTPTEKHIQLVKKYNSHKPWVWKDPRLCYTIGYWWPLLDHTNTRVIFLKRDSKEIYSSFLRLNWRTSGQEGRDDVMQRINHHISNAADSIARFKIPHIEVSYSDFAEQPEDTSKKIGEFFDIDLNVDALGFDKKLNTSGLRGAIMKIAMKTGGLLPDSLKMMIKNMLPKFLLKAIFPHRYSK